MTTTLGFEMFSFAGNKTVEALAKHFRNLRLNGALISEESVIKTLESLRDIDTEKFGEATDTAVREAVLNYVDDGVKTVDFGDGDVRNFPPTLTSGYYDYLKDGE
jgi:hypothetical protein